MIKTVAEFLLGLVESERQILDAVPLTHAPTIGDMYEGLSHEVLGRAIPLGLDLRLVSGFAVDGLGRMSGQLDCMLVRGEGTPAPYTDDYFWHVKDIIAVFEIKKTLYSAELKDAFQHLNEVKELEHFYNQSLRDQPGVIDISSAQRAFAETTRQVAPSYEQLESLSYERQMVFHTLVLEHLSALRIVIGYHGFKSEHSFRKALVDHLEGSIGVEGFGVGSFPQLIVSGGFTLAKANGQPYSSPLVKDDWWPFYFSTPVNPLLMLLEYVWTRLDRLYGIGGLWGEDLEVEVPHALLLAKAGRHEDGRVGWHYEAVNNSENALASLGDTEGWEPCFLTAQQFVVIDRLQGGGRIRFDDETLHAFLQDGGIEDLNAFWEELLATGLAARSGDGTELVLITKNCQTAVLPDGRLVAAENNTGRLFRWIERHKEEWAAPEPQGE